MKVYPFEIPKPISENLRVQEDIELVFFDKLHQHQEIQISLLVKGSGKLIIGDSIHSYEEEDIVVVGGKVPHLFQSLVSKEESHMISLFFKLDSFGPDFFRIPDLKQLLPFFDKSDFGFKIISPTSELSKLIKQMPSKDEFDRFVQFLIILKKIEESDIEILTRFRHPKALTSNEGKRLQSVIEYVMIHFNEDIRLDTVSKLAFMTPNGFCRFFKQRTNKTFFQFLIELRIEHVCQLLSSNKDITIAEASEKAGFKSISNFNRKFKKLKGMTPSSYMTSWRN
ncbi:MAG: AraC family transcriptional regulator [Maribacter sp.]